MRQDGLRADEARLQEKKARREEQKERTGKCARNVFGTDPGLTGGCICIVWLALLISGTVIYNETAYLEWYQYWVDDDDDNWDDDWDESLEAQQQQGLILLIAAAAITPFLVVSVCCIYAYTEAGSPLSWTLDLLSLIVNLMNTGDGCTLLVLPSLIGVVAFAITWICGEALSGQGAEQAWVAGMIGFSVSGGCAVFHLGVQSFSGTETGERWLGARRSPNGGFFAWTAIMCYPMLLTVGLVVSLHVRHDYGPGSTPAPSITLAPSTPAPSTLYPTPGDDEHHAYESFESSFGSWTNDGFTRIYGSTPTSNTGPSDGAYDGSYYIYAETSFPNNPGVFFWLARDFGNDVTSLSFYYNMYGSDMGTLLVGGKTDGGSTYTAFWSKSGNQGDSWGSAHISLSSSSYQALEFQYESGQSRLGDLALDAISVYSLRPDDDDSNSAAPNFLTLPAKLVPFIVAVVVWVG